MDKLIQYRIFIQVSEMGSFIKAAHMLELPRASVSAAIQELETDLGVRLLHRTTRRVQLTADGTQLLERVRRLLADADDIQRLFQLHQHQVSGRLNINVPSRIARRLIAPALPTLKRSFPELQLALGSTDRAIDLVQEGVDCVVRVGHLLDSSLFARTIGHIALINCASVDYLRQHGTPKEPGDLTHGHFSVGYASPNNGRELPWEYVSDGKTHEVAVPSWVIVNNAESYIACCMAGMGLIQIPRFDVQHLLDSRQLVEVMPEFRAASMPVSLLYPHRRQRSRRLNAFIEWFEVLMLPSLESPDSL
ncbi:LysR family transcriptional regulator [Pseudomonas sp. 09C 129]|uniref:LysR substrate-binding domain-containing protein n=1 Tax=Pseudomonas sp. 09C 129 TaxID=2054915 RepID=UPI000C6E0A80|nr:LysR family transcriptional regulator [Pseudomonas sp. 09C 129]AUG02847.1 LysR family transcriptional regulator [Pseudomonas sp. 09C 129]